MKISEVMVDVALGFAPGVIGRKVWRKALEAVAPLIAAQVHAQLPAPAPAQPSADVMTAREQEVLQHERANDTQPGWRREMLVLTERLASELASERAKVSAAEKTLAAIADVLGYVNWHEGAYDRISNERLVEEVRKLERSQPEDRLMRGGDKEYCASMAALLSDAEQAEVDRARASMFGGSAYTKEALLAIIDRLTNELASERERVQKALDAATENDAWWRKEFASERAKVSAAEKTAEELESVHGALTGSETKLLASFRSRVESSRGDHEDPEEYWVLCLVDRLARELASERAKVSAVREVAKEIEECADCLMLLTPGVLRGWARRLNAALDGGAP